MFAYENGIMSADGCPMPDVAQVVGTPFYGYSEETLEERAVAFSAAFHSRSIRTYYAVKANSNQAVLSLFARRGFGADIVSCGEMKRALAAGIPADRIVFSGVGKSAEDLALALEAGIHQVNIESAPELERLIRIAHEKGMGCDAVLRVNPDVEAGGHDKISTGRSRDKFGVAMQEAPRLFAAARDTPVRLMGLATHIGSQINETEPFRAAYRKVRALAEDLMARGFPVTRLDLGGGYGVCYHEEQPLPPEAFARAIEEEFRGFEAEIGIEPGRALVADAGVLVTTILYVKQAGDRRFIVVDAAMNDLIRPSLYEAWHRIMPVRQRAETVAMTPCDIVGPVCESGDIFARDRPLPDDLQAGELLAIMSAGAYGSSMASTYNTRPLIPEVLTSRRGHAVVRRRVPVEDLIALESVPPWLA